MSICRRPVQAAIQANRIGDKSELFFAIANEFTGRARKVFEDAFAPRRGAAIGFSFNAERPAQCSCLSVHGQFDPIVDRRQILAIALTVSPGDAVLRVQLQEQPQTQTLEWNQSEFQEYASVTGDVVWNNDEQRGYLRLVGMPANDPSVAQYQLWIVDPDRDANPIDGGVFDVPASGEEVLIPIDAKLQVVTPAAFAITREQPGGVVVSAGPLLLVAAS